MWAGGQYPTSFWMHVVVSMLPPMEQKASQKNRYEGRGWHLTINYYQLVEEVEDHVDHIGLRKITSIYA